MTLSVKAWAAAFAVAYAASLTTVSTQAPPVAPKTLRVCGDPDNLPYSNDRLQGFENRIASIVAADLGLETSYAWWPHQRGLVKNTLDAGTCDVIFGVPQGLETVLGTKPYYRSSYVIASRRGNGHAPASLDAPELKQLRIGVYTNTPVEESLARRGLLEHLTGYSLFFDPAGDRDRPAKLLDDLLAGTVDVALPWGPLAGYYAKKLNAPVEMTALPDEPGVPLSFSIGMGVKKGNRDLKTRLEIAIDRRQAEIRSVLDEFGVPLAAAPSPAAGTTRQERQEPDTSARPAETAPAQAGFKKLNPFKDNAEGIAIGKKLYVQVGCQGCHGGGGGGGMAVSLIDDSWKFGSDDETLFKLIKGQIPEQTMPTVYNMLPDEQVWQILAFIRTLYIGDPAKINW